MPATAPSQFHWFMPLWNRRWQLLACALLFQAAESLFFAPLLGLAGHALSGRPVVDSTGLLSFVLSPRGFLVLFLGAATLLTIRLLEHAGLSVIVLGSLQDKTVRAMAALRLMLYQLPRLASTGARIIGGALLLAIPLLATAGFFAGRLLPKHDINFYLTSRPPEFVMAVAIVGALAAITLAIGAWLFVRWRLVVQVCMFDGRRGWAAFREAASLSRGAWWPLAWRCFAVLAFELALASVAAALGQLLVRLVLNGGRMEAFSLVVSLGLLVLLRTVLSGAVVSIGACVDAAVFTFFYQKRRECLGNEPTLRALETVASTPAPVARRAQVLAVVALVVGLCVADIFAVCVMLESLRQQRPVTVTAHRGGHILAPENTVASMHEAIAVGAQYAEIDVQLTKDGVLVVTHDSDFSRMAGVARKVWELTYDEIRAIPLGTHSAPEFRNEPAPTFDEVLTAVKDRIRLNIELKYYGNHQPNLAQLVVEKVQARGMADQVIIQCLEYEPLQEVRRSNPKIPIGYLLSVNARRPARLKVDFLSAALKRVNGAFVRGAHRRGQEVYVWTVNTPETMERMIDLGVDSLITDQPAEALRLVRAYETLSPGERTLREARAWLAN